MRLPVPCIASRVLGLVLVLGACASATPGAQAPRIQLPEEVILFPADSVGPVAIRPVAPPYPPGERARAERATLVAAFVVDTSGMVEYRTVSFLQSASSAFVRSVCDALGRARFTPARVDGRARRALVLASFGFEVTPTLPPAPPPAVRRVPIDDLVARLEGAPHCS
jgi:hypothetical protein